MTQVLFLLVAIGAVLVVRTRDIEKQMLVLSVYGMVLTLLFVMLQAPDVALSELVIGGAALPLMLAAVARRVRAR